MKNEHLTANLASWDERAPAHARSEFYDLESFVAGRRSGLHPSERSELGAIEGKSLVQLQCHIGVETVAWARLGAARTVGLDFSPQAIAAARELAERCGLQERCEFVVADVHDAPRVLASYLPFDVCYVSVGATIWLPSNRALGRNLRRRARAGWRAVRAGSAPDAGHGRSCRRSTRRQPAVLRA